MWKVSLTIIEGNPENVVIDPFETIDCTIKVISQKGNEKRIQGTYDKKGLPDDWAELPPPPKDATEARPTRAPTEDYRVPFSIYMED